MAEDPDKKPSGEKRVVDDLLTELGVDDEMRQELIASGRMSSDVMRVESADQVRRRMEIDKSVAPAEIPAKIPSFWASLRDHSMPAGPGIGISSS